MIKLRVHDLAGEFGVSNDELMNMLRSMDVPVRSHLSQLTDEQVARLRARWEREKRARQEKPAATAGRRRRSTTTTKTEAVAAPAPVAAAPAASGAAPTRRRRKAADIAAAAATAAEAAAEAVVEAPVPSEVAQEPVLRPEVETPGRAAPRPGDGARAPGAEPHPGVRPGATPIRPGEPRRVPGVGDMQRPAAAADHAATATGRAAPAEWQRPRPVVPMPPRPRPAASSGTPYPPRPVASASPGGAPTLPGRREDKRGGKRKKGKRGIVDQEAVSANISKTMTALRGAPARRGSRRADEPTYREEMEAQRAAEAERERTTVRVNEFITVSELAAILKVPATQIVAFAFKNLGLVVTINQRLDFDQIELIAGEFGFQAVREQEYAAVDAAEQVQDAPESLRSRPPVVTIMGHVDHGKTSLLDYIRKANVVAGEAGGITQHIGAYHVTLPSRKEITFLDTPGHEAFTAMRARGAQVTDIVVLVVAADDQVMPQTVEAISHAKNAGVPLIVAINKIDLPTANVQKVKQDLLQHGVVLEEFGGTTLATPISAKKGTNVGDLLDQVLLQAEILDLKANPERRALGTVIEAQLDPGKGPVATVLVQNGTLKVGDDFIMGMYSGRVRNLFDERGQPVKEAGPAIPVQVLGMDGVPMAGDQMLVVEDATSSREIAQRRQRLDREAKSRRTSRAAISLEDFMSQAAAGQVRTLPLLIKADQGGPAEALADALGQLSNAEVKVDVVHRGVGAITESDILLAKASGAIIIGFHVRPDNNARASAEREGVDIKLYRVIYEAVADVRAALEGLLRPEQREVAVGEAEVRQLFKVPKAGTIAGSFVRSGVITRQAKVRVVRDGVEVYDGSLGSLRRFKDDVKEVREGFECGIGIENFNDVKVGDVIECYRTEQIARTL
ncbi:MAG TPA: translation initiation factor IF-2 [Gemmatimonadaceae bacterium]|nr:translation initiation factor IF-2 [Gemmatimonadaceae bacterium]